MITRRQVKSKESSSYVRKEAASDCYTMSYLMTMYYCVAGISTLLFIYSLYLIFKVSTPQMVPYIYYLLTIQLCAFLESMYWTVLMSPIVKVLPILGIELGGLVWMLFGIPSQYIFHNSTLIFDESFVTIGGPTTLLWHGILLVASTIALIALAIIIKHVSRILKDHAKFSQTSRDMHRNAITGLTIQGIAVMSSTVVPMCMLCHVLLLPPSSLTFISNYATSTTLLFSLKSFNASISMIFTTKPYRKHFATITGVNSILLRYSVSNVMIKTKEPTLVSSSAAVSANNQS